MKNETQGIAPLIIAVVVIVVAAGAGVGVYMVTRGGGGGTGGDIASATSLSYKMDMTFQEITMTTIVKMKDMGSSSTLKMRVEGTTMGEEFKFIADATQSAAYLWSAATGWQDVSAMFQTYFQQYQAQVEASEAQFTGWTGGDITYTDPTSGATIRIYDIEVNPSIPDSEFQSPI